MSKKQMKRRKKLLQEQQALVEAREEREMIELPDGAVEALNAQYKEYGAIAHALTAVSKAPPPTREGEKFMCFSSCTAAGVTTFARNFAENASKSATFFLLQF